MQSQNNKGYLFFEGRLAQLVQSICLTSRGSLVRTQYLPQSLTEMWGFFCFKLDTTNFMHYLYILYSKSLDKYYVGETSDITQRLNQHFSRFYKGSYTSQTDDWKKKLVIEFSTINQARKAEIFIKKMKSRKFIEQLIEDSIWLKEKFNN